jgi:hypothetical protein
LEQRLSLAVMAKLGVDIRNSQRYTLNHYK